jgi:hypothetical protein
MQDALRRYMDDNKMYCMEGERGVRRVERLMSQVWIR